MRVRETRQKRLQSTTMILRGPHQDEQKFQETAETHLIFASPPADCYHPGCKNTSPDILTDDPVLSAFHLLKYLKMYAARFRSSNGFIIFVVGAAVFTDMMLYGLVVPMLPYALVDRIGVPPEDVQKWNSILLGAFGGALMLGSLVIGWIGDRVNTRQTPFLLGLIALGLSTLAVAITRELLILLVARILQGLSSAVVSSVGYAILFDAIGSEKIGQALGYLSMSQSFGLMIGPAIGGTLYEYGGYFVTFIPAFVLIAIEILLRSLVVIPLRAKRGQSLAEEVENSDAALLSKGYTANPLYGTSQPPRVNQDNDSLLTPGEDAKDPSRQHTVSDQLTDNSSKPTTTPTPSTTTTFSLFFASPRIVSALIVLFITNVILTSYDAIVPIYIRATFSLSAAHASLLFLIMVSSYLLSPIAGYVVDRHGTGIPATTGLAVMVPPILALQYVDSETKHPFLAIAAGLFGIGFASAICLPALMAE
ncbi:MAG: hypothetical protein Q9218_002503, partial [Villophora microphyllina]